MKIIPYKTACTNGLPDDKHMMFETCKELSSNINLKSVHLLVTLHNNLVNLSCMFNAPIFFSAESTIQICNSAHFTLRLLLYVDQS
jgi:hypothetical protein